jgi:tetratricopeptide (TPR) repeat protein
MPDATATANITDLDRAQNLYQAGRVHMAAGAFEEAVQAFTDCIAIYPHFKALELVGECLLVLGKPTQAVVPLAAATALNDQVRAPSLLSQALLAIGDYERAAKVAATVLARSPGNRVARAVLENPFVQRVLVDDGA